MNAAPITAFYASLLALWYLFLATRVVLFRRERRIGIGTGGDQDMARRVRVHANAAEYLPLALLLMLLVEVNTALFWLLHGAGVALIAGRVAHAIGLGGSVGKSWGRALGTSLTWGVILLLAGLNLGFALYRMM